MNIKNIKVGMSLKRKYSNHGNLREGDIGIVEKVGSDIVVFEGNPAVHSPSNLEFVEDLKPKQLSIFN